MMVAMSSKHLMITRLSVKSSTWLDVISRMESVAIDAVSPKKSMTVNTAMANGSSGGMLREVAVVCRVQGEVNSSGVSSSRSVNSYNQHG